MLSVEQPLPQFSGEALLPNGEFAPVNLSDYKGKWLVLFFYPLDFTFVCPTEIRGFNELHSEFSKLNTVVLGASVDSVHCHKAWTESSLGKIAFPLIGDLTRSLAQDCGVLSEEGFSHRATFVANPDGIIESVTVNSSNVGRSPQETLRVVQALQAGGLAPCDWQPGQSLLNAA
ncbi:MAG: thioredoxin peroxidase [Burkholderiales bacterium RIFCSPLOWO2_02_FULL_57_36]|nr:MAG: thioredoxin peroxidase [Burkholderiales bacterium RIFCSPLOWO2_02_FULL_57_36]